MKSCLPKAYYPSIQSISYKKLKKQGIHYLLFDLDNTIIPAHINKVTKKDISFFENLKKEFTVIIVSNSLKRRVSFISQQLKLPFYSFSCKPTSRIYKAIKKEYNCKYSEIAMIGDQLFTDMFGGNRLGIYTILVDPISKKDFILTKFTRYLEKKQSKNLKKHGFQKGKYYD